MTLFTGRGDDGTTGILGAGRFSKDDFRFEVLGTLDEASAALGLARAQCTAPVITEIVVTVQRDLYWMMAEAAADEENAGQFLKINAERVFWLEQQISRCSESVPIPKEFILPGDSVGSAALDVARTIVRRAERRVVALLEAGGKKNCEWVRYLNRLSSLVYLLEIVEIQYSGKEGPSLAK